MYNLDWTKEDPPEVTYEDFEKLELELGVKIPDMLKILITMYGGAMPERNGELARVATLPNSETGQTKVVGYLVEFIKPYYPRNTIDWSNDEFNFRPEKIIPFASDGASEICLYYDNDPTNANPDIRNVWTGGDTFESAWKYLAPNMETFINNLKTESEAKEMGIL